RSGSRTASSCTRSRSKAAMNILLRMVAIASSLLGAEPAFAAQAEVNFVDADDFTDARKGDGTNETILREIRAHLVELAQHHLPAMQVLKIDVLDVDLCGNLDVKRLGPEVRVVGIDTPPRMTLRFSLEENGQVLLSGKDELVDRDYFKILT